MVKYLFRYGKISDEITDAGKNADGAEDEISGDDEDDAQKRISHGTAGLFELFLITAGEEEFKTADGEHDK